VDPKAARNTSTKLVFSAERSKSDSGNVAVELFLTVFRLPPPPRKTAEHRSGVLLHQCFKAVKNHPELIERYLGSVGPPHGGKKKKKTKKKN